MLQPLFGFNWFGIPIYFVFLAIALLVGVNVLKKQQNGKIYGKPALLATIILSFVIANISSWFLYPDIRFVPLNMRFTIGVMFFYAGMLSFFGLSILFRFKNEEWKQWIHEAVPAFIIFSFFERIGAILAGHGYGLPLSIEGIPLITFPAREIEALALLALYFVFKKVKQHRFPLYLLSYSILRFALEFGRGDDRGRLFIEFLSPTQVVSICVWVGLIVWLILKIVKKDEASESPAFKPREPFISGYKTVKRFASVSFVLASIIIAVFIWINPFNTDSIYRLGRSVSDFSREITNNGRSANWLMAEERYYTEYIRLIRDSWSDYFFGHIIFTLDEYYMTVDGSPIEIGIAPTINEDVIMLPIQEIIGVINETEYLFDSQLLPVDTVADRLALEFEWHEETQQIRLTRDFQTRRLIVTAVTEMDFTQLGATNIFHIRDSTRAFLQFATVRESIEAYTRLSMMENVAWVGPDRLVTFSPASAGGNFSTDDNNNIHNSWGVTESGLAQYAKYLYDSGVRGTIRVAVLDSGIDAQHPLFRGRNITSRNFTVERDANDSNGHGTHVAGIIIDSTPGLNIELSNIKVLRHNPRHNNLWNAWGLDSHFEMGVIHATENGAHVINMSLGVHGINLNLQMAIDHAISNGVIVVVSAGNCGEECQSERHNCRGFADDYSPASHPLAITVAASTYEKGIAGFSSRSANPAHQVVNIAAPGEAIKSSVPTFRDSSGFMYMRGTSMAAPHVAAAVAMYKLANPGITSAEVMSAVTGYVYRPDGWNIAFGTGILDMRRAIPSDFLQPPPPLTPPPMPPPGQEPVMAYPISARVLVDGEPVLRNGEEVALSAYNIGGYNSYFRLIDLSYALQHTQARFSVEFVEADNSVRIVRRANYIPPQENEMIEAGTATVEELLPTQQSIFIDGFAVNLQAYNIGGFNYFMLRQLGGHLFFHVDWEEATNTILITTESAGDGESGAGQAASPPDINEAEILNGRFVRADGLTGILAGFPWVEFRGNQFTIPLHGGLGGVSTTSNYTFNNGNITFQVEGADITWRVEIINNNAITVDFGMGVGIEFVRE